MFIALLIACAIGFGIDQLAELRESFVGFYDPHRAPHTVGRFLIALNTPLMGVVICPVIVLACWLMGSVRARWRSWRGRPALIDKEVIDTLFYWNHAGHLLAALAVAMAWPFFINVIVARTLYGAWHVSFVMDALGLAFYFYIALLPSSLIGLLLARQATAMCVHASPPEPSDSRAGGIAYATLTCFVYMVTLSAPMLLLPRAISNIYWLGDNTFDRLVLALLGPIVLLIGATRWHFSRARP